MHRRLRELVDDDGTLPAYAWPGGYPVLYLDRENAVLCPSCANAHNAVDELPAFRPVDYYIHWEGPAAYCQGCDAAIESAYGDPATEGEEYHASPHLADCHS